MSHSNHRVRTWNMIIKDFVREMFIHLENSTYFGDEDGIDSLVCFMLPERNSAWLIKIFLSVSGMQMWTPTDVKAQQFGSGTTMNVSWAKPDNDKSTGPWVNVHHCLFAKKCWFYTHDQWVLISFQASVSQSICPAKWLSCSNSHRLTMSECR